MYRTLPVFICDLVAARSGTIFTFSLCYCCFWWILFGIIVTSFGLRELVALLFFSFGMCTVCCNLFALPPGIIGGQTSVILALPGHLIHSCPQPYRDKYIYMIGTCGGLLTHPSIIMGNN